MQVRTICDVIPPPEDCVHRKESCCGEGLLAEALARQFDTAVVHALDGSHTMPDATAARLGPFAGCVDTPLFELADMCWRRFPWPLHAIVSSFAVHPLIREGKSSC